jgi:DNA-binding beta-propeller fold protein YncE
LRNVAFICFAIVATAALSASPALAAQTHLYTGTFFGPDGTPASASFGNVQGVAVDQATGSIYVYDAGVGKVYKFDSAGEPV